VRIQAAIDDMFTIAPRVPVSRMTFKARRVTMNGPVRLTVENVAPGFGGHLGQRASMLIPLLLTTTSSLP